MAFIDTDLSDPTTVFKVFHYVKVNKCKRFWLCPIKLASWIVRNPNPTVFCFAVRLHTLCLICRPRTVEKKTIWLCGRDLYQMGRHADGNCVTHPQFLCRDIMPLLTSSGGEVEGADGTGGRFCVLTGISKNSPCCYSTTREHQLPKLTKDEYRIAFSYFERKNSYKGITVLP